MTSADVDPKLTAQDVDDLLEDHARVDAEGRLPDHDEWEPTYDLNMAAAAGWDLKAALCAHQVGFSADGASFHLEQLRANAEAQAELYRKRAAGAIGQIDVAAAAATPALGPNQVANL